MKYPQVEAALQVKLAKIQHERRQKQLDADNQQMKALATLKSRQTAMRAKHFWTSFLDSGGRTCLIWTSMTIAFSGLVWILWAYVTNEKGA